MAKKKKAIAKKKMVMAETSKNKCCYNHSKVGMIIMALIMIGLGALLWINFFSLNEIISIVLVIMGLKKIYWASKI